MHTRRAIVSHR